MKSLKEDSQYITSRIQKLSNFDSKPRIRTSHRKTDPGTDDPRVREPGPYGYEQEEQREVSFSLGLELKSEE
jgi:hypothetical protein